MIPGFRVKERAPDFQFHTPWEDTREFHSTLGESPGVLIFLRYHGCPVCQIEMARLKKEIGLFREKGAKVFVCLQSSIETVAPLLEPDDFPFEIICDPEAKIFIQYRVEPGGVLRYLHPSGLIAALKAMGKGFFHKKFEGRETQLPAAFVIDPQKRFSYVYYGRTINDLPPVSELADCLIP